MKDAFRISLALTLILFGFIINNNATQATSLIASTATHEPVASSSPPVAAATPEAEIPYSPEPSPVPRKKVVASAPTSDRLVIPSIGLDKAIGSVGLTQSGNMDVLDDPSRVGWYRGGTVPGNVGSAVMGAHVYQAFSNLKNVEVGDSIYVEKKDGRKLRFVVRDIKVYAYTDPSPLRNIFLRRDTARLNLITCYGSKTGGTYTHRLVVYATLA